MRHFLKDWYVLLFIGGFLAVALGVTEGIFEWADRRRARKATEAFEKWLRETTEVFDQDSQEA